MVGDYYKCVNESTLAWNCSEDIRHKKWNFYTNVDDLCLNHKYDFIKEKNLTNRIFGKVLSYPNNYDYPVDCQSFIIKPNEKDTVVNRFSSKFSEFINKNAALIPDRQLTIHKFIDDYYHLNLIFPNLAEYPFVSFICDQLSGLEEAFIDYKNLNLDTLVDEKELSKNIAKLCNKKHVIFENGLLI